MVVCLIRDLSSSDGGMPGFEVWLGVVTMSLFMIPVFVPYSVIHSIKGIFIPFNCGIHTVLNTGEIAVNFVSFVIALGKGYCDAHQKIINSYFFCRRIT